MDREFNIILCGVGGQGILFLSKFLISCAKKSGLNAKQSEVHGMAQRGGAVVAHLRLSDKEIFSPLIPENQADLIISMEPIETFRYAQYTNQNTKIVVSKEPIKNIDNYPDIDDVLNALKNAKAVIIEDATNMTLAGCASKYIPIDKEIFAEVLNEVSQGKSSDIIAKNKQEFERGLNYDL